MQPAETAVPNANLSRTKINNGRGRGEKLVRVANSNSGAAQEPEKSENWTEVDKTFWPGNDKEFFGQDAENGKLNLPANCGIREIHRATSGSPSAHRFQFFSFFSTFAMLDMVVDETQKHVDKLAEHPAPPPAFSSHRADRNSRPPKFVRCFYPNFCVEKLNDASLYRFIACLKFSTYQARMKSLREGT